MRGYSAAVDNVAEEFAKRGSFTQVLATQIDPHLARLTAIEHSAREEIQKRACESQDYRRTLRKQVNRALGFLGLMVLVSAIGMGLLIWRYYRSAWSARRRRQVFYHDDFNLSLLEKEGHTAARKASRLMQQFLMPGFRPPRPKGLNGNGRGWLRAPLAARGSSQIFLPKHVTSEML